MSDVPDEVEFGGSALTLSVRVDDRVENRQNVRNTSAAYTSSASRSWTRLELTHLRLRGRHHDARTTGPCRTDRPGSMGCWSSFHLGVAVPVDG